MNTEQETLDLWNDLKKTNLKDEKSLKLFQDFIAYVQEENTKSYSQVFQNILDQASFLLKQEKEKETLDLWNDLKKTNLKDEKSLKLFQDFIAYVQEENTKSYSQVFQNILDESDVLMGKATIYPIAGDGFCAFSSIAFAYFEYIKEGIIQNQEEKLAEINELAFQYLTANPSDKQMSVFIQWLNDFIQDPKQTQIPNHLGAYFKKLTAFQILNAADFENKCCTQQRKKDFFGKQAEETTAQVKEFLINESKTANYQEGRAEFFFRNELLNFLSNKGQNFETSLVEDAMLQVNGNHFNVKLLSKNVLGNEQMINKTPALQQLAQTSKQPTTTQTKIKVTHL